MYFPLSSHQDDLGEHVVVHGPWDIRPVGDPTEDDEDQDDDSEGDVVPVIKAD